ncbi:PilC/PilY family type IV pilus protein [Neptunomonas sp. XY-337]|uniref:pilus assembly protein n=1 Tax=Neptunomonas sp. XY-337 TaxID=2561897 RepID=UPI0010AB206C|nr:PilC/PilY family type IV pilus protein [Neptunomonas sp. XY-337]
MSGNNSSYRLLLASALVYSAHSSAAPLDLADTPLSVSSSVEPNVMLLIDNSGSMNNMVFEDGFVPGTLGNADRWAYLHTNGNYYWINNGNTYYFGYMDDGSCSWPHRRFLKPSTNTHKCMIAPTPEGSGDTRYYGEYLNYLLDKYPSGTDLRAVAGFPQQTRMGVAKQVASDIVQNTPKMRFGVARFNSSNDGATVDQSCGANTASIISSISGYTASTWTPLAEALYEVTRYFRGMTSPYRNVSYTSPIQYRCQSNFTIAITDGFPTRDKTFPTSFPSGDKDVPAGSAFPDWDGLHPATSSSQHPNFPHFSDGFDPNSDGEGGTLYLDDIAKFAWDIDFKNTTAPDNSGQSYNDPLFKVQNMYTYTVGFATQNNMLQDAAQYGNGLYFTATNAQQLTDVLKRALLDISDKSTSATAVAANTGRVQSGSSVYQAKFHTADWSGDLLSFGVETDKTSPDYGDVLTSGSGPQGAQWSAEDKMPGWNSRRIFTNLGNSGKRFRWGTFNAAQRTEFFNGEQAMLQYLRGRNTSDASFDVSGYRTRTSALADIVNSAPQYKGRPNGRYKDSLEGPDYSSFVAANRNREPMIYVGANDGMLHGFNANTGVERMAFVPGSLLPRLKELADTGYTHRYFVDATPTVVDAFVNGAWRTVLTGGLGKGAQSVYALDVTNPASFGESDSNAANLFMWEFTDADDADLGYVYGRPKIVKMQDGRWYAVFGNGYNNTVSDDHVSGTGNAVVYIVDLASKNFIKLNTGVGASADPTGKNRPNGISTATPVDVDGDFKADYIYAGDLFGNVWKFDVTGSSTSSWKLGYKLFTACPSGSCGTTQPITSGISTGFTSDGVGLMVFFGTGKHLEIDDNNAAAGGLQSLYGILDKGAPVSRSNLLKQIITSEKTATFTDTKGTDDPADDTTEPRLVRETSDYAMTNEQGWYLDLKYGAENGERVINAPEVRGDRVFFISTTPGNDECLPGGVSWIYQLGSKDGKQLQSTWDLYEDGKFDSKDGPYTGVQVGEAAGFNTMVDDFGEQIYLGLERLGANANALLQNRQSWQEVTQ